MLNHTPDIMTWQRKLAVSGWAVSMSLYGSFNRGSAQNDAGKAAPSCGIVQKANKELFISINI